MELLRWAWNLWVRVDPRIRAPARGAAVPPATTDQTRDALPRDVRRRTVVMRNAVLTPEDRALLGSRRAGPARPRACAACSPGGCCAGRAPRWRSRRSPRTPPIIRPPSSTSTARVPSPLTCVRAQRRRAWPTGSCARRVPREDLLTAYGEHHVFLFPSMHDSGGTVAGEALAAGLPVCLDRVGRRLRPADAGLKVPPTSPRAAVAGLTAGLRRLTDEPAAWRRAADAAYAYATDPANDPPVEARIRALYSRAGVLG